MKIDCIIEFKCKEGLEHNNYESVKRIVKIDSPNNKIIYDYSHYHYYICGSVMLVHDILKHYNIDEKYVPSAHLPNGSILGCEKDYLRFLVEFYVDNAVMRKFKIESLIGKN